MIYGLIAAAAWGLSTVAAAGAARQLGSYYAVLISQLLGLIGLGMLAAVKHPVLAPDARPLAGLAAAGVLGLIGWLCYYRALETGPVGLVSAIGASYGGVTALLAVAVLGERIGVAGGAGIVLATAGVALAAARARPASAAAAAGEADQAAAPDQAAAAPPRRPALSSLALPATAGPDLPGPAASGSSLAGGVLPGAVLPGAGLPGAVPPGAGPSGAEPSDAARPRQAILRRAGACWRAVQPVTLPEAAARAAGARRRPPSWRREIPQPGTPGPGLRRRLFSRPGTTLALGSALVYGVGAFLLGRYSAREGWLAATLITYAASVLTLAAALPFAGRARGPWPGVRGLAWAIVAGVTEVIALLAFARGGQAGQVAVTAAVSSLSPALVLAAGFLVFRERLSGRQLLGAACIIAGLILLGLT